MMHVRRTLALLICPELAQPPVPQSRISSFLILTEAFAVGTGLAVSTISRKATGSGDTYRRLGLTDHEGKPVHRTTTERMERAVRWFQLNWPADLEWPKGVPRPTDQRAA